MVIKPQKQSDYTWINSYTRKSPRGTKRVHVSGHPRKKTKKKHSQIIDLDERERERQKRRLYQKRRKLRKQSRKSRKKTRGRK